MSATRGIGVGLAIGILMSACGASGSEGPEATIRSYATAILEGDSQRAKAAWVDEKLLAEHFTCPSEGAKLAGRVKYLDEDIQRRIDNRPFKRIEVVGVAAPTVTNLAAGGDVRGCSVKHDVQVAEAQVSMKVTNKGTQVVSDTDPMTFIELDGRWYLVSAF